MSNEGRANEDSLTFQSVSQLLLENSMPACAGVCRGCPGVPHALETTLRSLAPVAARAGDSQVGSVEGSTWQA
eukprot:7096497-Alexandrium_andersonii.AAC.1